MKFETAGATIEIDGDTAVFYWKGENRVSRYPVKKINECEYYVPHYNLRLKCDNYQIEKPVKIDDKIPMTDKILLSINKPIDNLEKGFSRLNKEMKFLIIAGLIGLYLWKRK